MVRYSCTIPGNLFVGYDAMLRDIKDGLRDGDSFAIIGLGKSSMLEQMKEVLPNSPNIKPRVLDIYELNTVSLNILYKKLYSLCIKEIPNAPEWKDGNDDSAYQKFQDILTSAKPLIDTKYSDNWIMVFLINKIERLAEKLNDRRFFDNMANFRMHSDFKRHFRIIATGGRMLSYLTQTGSIFSGILKKHYLGILKEGDAQLLIQKGLPYRLKPDVERLFLRM
ncbi:MAG: hypothetical protein HQK97_07795, partial [Nitrospirae bacterium]|nr:hypothetical protein [Nitrospirota bacterium]